MTKTATPTPDKPTPPPSDAQIVKEFIAHGEALTEALKTEGRDMNYFMIQGHAEARQQLADMLESGKAARAQYVKDAGERIIKVANDAGKAVADLVNKLHIKAEERADQDRK